MRHEHFVFRNAGRLRGDRVGIDAEQGKLIAAERIGAGETGHQTAPLGLDRFPEDRLLLERTDILDRLTDGGRDDVRDADDIQRRLHDRLGGL